MDTNKIQEMAKTLEKNLKQNIDLDRDDRNQPSGIDRSSAGARPCCLHLFRRCGVEGTRRGLIPEHVAESAIPCERSTRRAVTYMHERRET